MVLLVVNPEHAVINTRMWSGTGLTNRTLTSLSAILQEHQWCIRCYISWSVGPDRVQCSSTPVRVETMEHWCRTDTHIAGS
jgi:hypothetical protein